MEGLTWGRSILSRMFARMGLLVLLRRSRIKRVRLRRGEGAMLCD
jgi:hypothetical protein